MPTAVLPRNGESYFDAVGDDSGMPEILRSQATETAAGWMVSPEPFFAPEGLGVVDEADAVWLARRLTAHPLSALADKVVLSGAADRLPKTYVRCGRLPVPVLENLASSLETQPHWQVERWDCGHDVMITEPDRVVDLLRRIEAGRPTVAARPAVS
ncbi:hypothetical protein [Amycolatopsis pigmentata]|uniref:Alpha/beta hydrolase family protein n=1 Tax=Amycolatopsis pigmentata TaxID=450801 RepID=A0ABW5G4S1_9PSEU